MLIRPASLDDIPYLERWDQMEHVIACSGDPGDDEDTDWAAEVRRRVSWYEIVIAEEMGRPIGVMQIINPAEEESRYWGDIEPYFRAIDIWIGEPDMLGKGHGSLMMRMALATCFADPGVKAVIIDPLASNTRAIKFYERIGFRPVERRMFGADDCLVMRMNRDEFNFERR
jgi:aminoglycoside 6'-N-acetyltransferase